MKKKIMTIFVVACSLFHANAQITQVVSLSTGVVNHTSSLIAVNNADDTWQVALPGSPTVFNTVNCTNGSLINGSGTVYTGVWGSDASVRWLSPYVDALGNATNTGPNGNYLYRMMFRTDTICSPDSAIITLTHCGADDSLKSITVNTGSPHPLHVAFSPLLGTTRINVSGNIIAGTNTIVATVNNQGTTYTGLLIDGFITLYYHSYATPACSITGGSSFCVTEQPLSFTGAVISGVANSYYWSITECTSAGAAVAGGYTWDSFYTGSPSTITFPTLACDKYYKILLSVNDACKGYSDVTKIIHVYCLPPVDAGPDVSICPGDCVTIGVSGRTPAGVTYSWAGTGLLTPPTTKQITVCPTVTTTYTLTASIPPTECITMDVVTVTVRDDCDPNGLTVKHPGNYKELPVAGSAIEAVEPVIYPNPGTGAFTLTLNAATHTSIEIYDMLGNKVKSAVLENATDYTFDLSGYPKGIYLLNMIVNDQRYMKKIILE